RQALVAANADAVAGVSDTIVFDSSLAGEKILLTQGQLEVSGTGTGTITIDASSLSSPITIDALGTGRVFQVDSGVTAVFNNLVITGGAVTNASGGGILNSGTLTLSHVTVSGNSASDGGGGIDNESGTLILNGGTTVSGNSTQGSGGGIYND